MSSRSATRRASPESWALQQPFLCAGVPSSGPWTPVRMNRPTTSYPCCLSKYAATELSTPPLIANTTRRDMSFPFGHQSRLLLIYRFALECEREPINQNQRSHEV